jgi:tripartite-type tricarboxylate transporter receptor subunit TctC
MPMNSYSNLVARISIFAILTLAALAEPASAQTFPNRPVHAIVPYGPGGSLDVLARIICSKLSHKWQQSIIVENKPGGGGTVGTVSAANTSPDGYTLVFGAQSLSVNVIIAPLPNFNPVDDLTPISLIATARDVLVVGPDSPFKSVGDLLQWNKLHQGETTYASSGIGSSAHLATVLFSEVTGLSGTHVPYTSPSQALTDVMSGRVSFWIGALVTNLGAIQAGKLHALAVSGDERSTSLPDIPTFKEQGIPFVTEATWLGLFAPKGLPKALIDQISKAVNEVLDLSDVKEQLNKLGYRIVRGSPDALNERLIGDIEKYRKFEAAFAPK